MQIHLVSYCSLFYMYYSADGIMDVVLKCKIMC